MLFQLVQLAFVAVTFADYCSMEELHRLTDELSRYNTKHSEINVGVMRSVEAHNQFMSASTQEIQALSKKLTDMKKRVGKSKTKTDGAAISVESAKVEDRQKELASERSKKESAIQAEKAKLTQLLGEVRRFRDEKILPLRRCKEPRKPAQEDPSEAGQKTIGAADAQTAPLIETLVATTHRMVKFLETASRR